MKWNSQKPIKVGQTRSVRMFLWFPLTLDGITKWLEFATVMQKAEKFVYHEDVGETTRGIFIKHEEIVWRNHAWAKD